MRIAITGGSGTVGEALGGQLAAAGHETVIIRRGTPGSAGADWDPYNGWVRPDAFDGCDGVVHLSSASIAGERWSDDYKKELRRSRLETSRVLIEHLSGMERKPQVLVSASAVGYYGDAGDRVLTEDSPPGEGFLARLCVDWEAAVQPAEDAGIRVVTMRCAPALESLLPRMLFPFKMGVGGPLGRGKHYMPWISLEDMAGAYVHALTTDLRGPVNTAGPQQVTNKEFTKALGSAIHRPTIFPVPPPALSLLFGSGAKEFLLYSQRVEPAKLLASNYKYRYRDIDAALAAALANIKREAA